MNLRMTVARTFHECPLDRTMWDGFLDEHWGAAAASYDHCRQGWLCDGDEPDGRLRLLSWQRADRLVGLLPLRLESLHIGPVSLRLARPLGAPQALADLPIERALLLPALNAAFDRLFRIDGCTAVALGTSAAAPAALSTGLAESLCLPPPLLHAQPGEAGPAMVFYCPDWPARRRTSLLLTLAGWRARLTASGPRPTHAPATDRTWQAPASRP